MHLRLHASESHHRVYIKGPKGRKMNGKGAFYTAAQASMENGVRLSGRGAWGQGDGWKD